MHEPNKPLKSDAPQAARVLAAALDINVGLFKMTVARSHAIALLPILEKAVFDRRVLTYGQYAVELGLGASGARAVAQPLHAISAMCVIACIPIAPLYFVKRADKMERQIFESDWAESVHVLPHYKILFVTARESVYTRGNFAALGRVLEWNKDVSARALWKIALSYCPKDSNQTYFDRALEHYRALYDELSANWRKSKKR